MLPVALQKQSAAQHTSLSPLQFRTHVPLQQHSFYLHHAESDSTEIICMLPYFEITCQLKLTEPCLMLDGFENWSERRDYSEIN